MKQWRRLVFPRKGHSHGEEVRSPLWKEGGFKPAVPVRSGLMALSSFCPVQAVLCLENRNLLFPGNISPWMAKCRLGLQREVQLSPGRPHWNTKPALFMQEGGGMRLGTELRATRRGWLGDPAMGGDSGRFSPASSALLSPPSGGSDHHWSQ